MRAPLCPDSNDLCPEDQGLIGSANDNTQIQGLEKSLERRNSNKTAVFGIGLESLMGMSPQVAPQIPFVLSRLCRYIEASGLHHKNLFMENDEKNLVETLKIEFKESGDAPLEAAGNVASAAKLLLIFFEELPEPLIPLSIQPTFINNMDKLSLSSVECINHLRHSVGKLPDCTFIVLKYLSRFLLRVACHQQHNGMSSDNLALIFGPILFRISPDDNVNLIPVKNIMSCFVSEYYAIFEDNGTEDPSISLSISESLPANRRKQLPCPSSVMPLMSLSPLTVVIPSMDSDYKAADENEDPNRNVPILLIEERQMDSTLEQENEKNLELEISRDIIGVLPTRKRKERRLSGEEAQMQRSSSEERPPLTTTLSFEKNELMRRCSSHEEMAEGIKSDVKFDPYIIKKATIKENENLQPADSYFVDALDNVLNDKDHSPHPPNAKRREVELPTTRKADHASMENYSTSGSLIQDCVVLPWQNNIELGNGNDVPPSTHIDKPLNLDLTCAYNLEQNSLAELESELTMDCSAPKSPSDSDELSDLDSKKMGLPRSASCPVPKTDNENSSESESSSLSLSWSMLFETENTEPLRSEHRYSWPLTKDAHEEDTLLSPSVQHLRKSSLYEAPLSPSAYRSYLSYRSTHLDASIPPSPPVEQEDFAKSSLDGNAAADSIKQLTKKIHGLKKKIRKFDENFESEFGYKPSHAEKAIHPDAKKLMNDLHKARKELKSLKEESHLEHVSSGASWHPSRDSHILGDTTNSFLNEAPKDKSKPTYEESVDDTLKSLADDRRYAKRPDEVEDMSNEQVKDEKFAIQKALLHFESIHGRPSTKSDRNIIRPLYERYRSVKKLLVRAGSFPSTSSKNKDSCSELQPILEHETMDFTPPQQRTGLEAAIENNEEHVPIEKEEIAPKPEPDVEPTKSPEPISSEVFVSKYDNSNIHELPLSEMIFQMQKAKSEKRHLRKILREFEVEFQRLNGRKVQKEDKAPVEALYGEYKHVKARLKLLEALISKHDQHQLM